MLKTGFLALAVLLAFACSKGDNSPIDQGGQIPDTGDSIPELFTPCENGMAASYPCLGLDMLGHLPMGLLKATYANDIWGWQDPVTDREYALIGLDNGTAFVDITETGNITYLGKLPTATTNSSWRDIKVYEDFALIVSEAAGHGMQIFDLTRLRSVTGPPVTFDADARYTGFGNCHNIVVNPANDFAYAVGTARDDAFNGGVHFINMQDPLNPMAAGGFGMRGYTHDAQVITYNGPDTNYTGKEILIGSNETQVVLVDVTDKEAPVLISSFQYGNISYTHQGWVTEDHRYLLLGDEGDEINFGFNSRTLVFDLTDLTNPMPLTPYIGATTAIDHNGYVLGNEFYLANYSAGLRVMDISGISGQSITEKAYFDTQPENNTASFTGAWSVYPYFESGKIIVSDIGSGLFVLAKTNP